MGLGASFGAAEGAVDGVVAEVDFDLSFEGCSDWAGLADIAQWRPCGRECYTRGWGSRYEIIGVIRDFEPGPKQAKRYKAIGDCM